MDIDCKSNYSRNGEDIFLSWKQKLYRQIYHLDGLTHHGVPVFAIVLIVVSWLVLLMVLVMVKGLLVVGRVEVVLL